LRKEVRYGTVYASALMNVAQGGGGPKSARVLMETASMQSAHLGSARGNGGLEGDEIEAQGRKKHMVLKMNLGWGRGVQYIKLGSRVRHWVP